MSVASRFEPPVGVLRLLGSYYFFFYAGLGAFMPYLPLLLSGRGLDATQIGMAMSLVPIADAVAPPLWGLAADAWSWRDRLLVLGSLGAGAAAVLFAVPMGVAGTLMALALFCVLRAPLSPLADAAVRSALGAASASFSHVRLWGSVGFGLTVVGIGLAGGAAHPLAMVGVMVAGAILASLVAARLPAPPRLRHHGVGAAAVRLVRQPKVALLLVATGVYYLAHSAYDAYIGLHLVALGHSQAIVGIAWGIAVAVEVGLMIFVPRLLRRHGARRLLAFCAVVATARWLMLAMLEDASAILATQPLHAVTFGLWYVCMVDAVQELCGEELRSTMQAIMTAAIAIGRIVAFAAGGRILELFGSPTLYAIAAVAAASSLPMYLAASRLRTLPEVLPARLSGV